MSDNIVEKSETPEAVIDTVPMPFRYIRVRNIAESKPKWWKRSTAPTHTDIEPTIGGLKFSRGSIRKINVLWMSAHKEELLKHVASGALDYVDAKNIVEGFLDQADLLRSNNYRHLSILNRERFNADSTKSLTESEERSKREEAAKESYKQKLKESLARDLEGTFVKNSSALSPSAFQFDLPATIEDPVGPDGEAVSFDLSSFSDVPPAASGEVDTNTLSEVTTVSVQVDVPAVEPVVAVADASQTPVPVDDLGSKPVESESTSDKNTAKSVSKVVRVGAKPRSSSK